MCERPYLRKFVKDLSAIVDGPRVDTLTLHAVYAELPFRSTRTARALRKALQKRLQERKYFKWPSTDAIPGPVDMGSATYQYKQGPLGFMGYRVGHSGIGAAKRRHLLFAVYKESLPRINSTEYMAKWGQPGTASRLKKLVYFIAGLAKERKRNDPERYRAAIHDWESDLAYLKASFYDGRYDRKFEWPRS